MKNGRLYKVLLIFFLAAAVVSCMAQLTKKQERKKSEAEQNISRNTVEESLAQTVRTEINYTTDSASEEINETMTYPEYSNNLQEEDINPEAYSPYLDMEIRCYFTNTGDTLDKAGAFPLKAQGRLTEDMQRFLNEHEIAAEEMRCIDGSLQDNSFAVQSVETNERIKVTYLSDAEIWKFKIEGH